MKPFSDVTFLYFLFSVDGAKVWEVETNSNFTRVPYRQNIFVLIFRNQWVELRAKNCLNSTPDEI